MGVGIFGGALRLSHNRKRVDSSEVLRMGNVPDGAFVYKGLDPRGSINLSYERALEFAEEGFSVDDLVIFTGKEQDGLYLAPAHQLKQGERERYLLHWQGSWRIFEASESRRKERLDDEVVLDPRMTYRVWEVGLMRGEGIASTYQDLSRGLRSQGAEPKGLGLVNIVHYGGPEKNEPKIVQVWINGERKGLLMKENQRDKPWAFYASGEGYRILP